MQTRKTWWTFRIFFIFSAWGSGRGSLRRREGGVDFFIENPRGGGSPGEGVSVANWGMGGRLIFFLGGRDVHQEKEHTCATFV